MFKSVAKRELLSKVVATSIEDAIRKRQLSPGGRLPTEQQLCAQFGVSRTSVREALRTLSAKGLVTVTKGKGIFVKAPSAEAVTTPMHLYLQLKSEKNYVLDIIHARQIIEPPIAASAALHRTAEDIKRLEKDIKDLELSDSNFKSLATLDMEFHLDIARASQNAIMPLLLDPIHRLMPEIKSHIYATVADAKQSAVVWHGKILEQIIQGNAEGAREAMVQHLKIAEEHSQSMLAAEKTATPR
ncbi:MAG: FadR/GntR family transcriptional regulator [Bacteroidota bacterium]